MLAMISWAADNLWRNNGDGTFTESLAEAMPHTTWSSMGAAAGDVNNDGYPDFLSADMAATSHYKDKIGMGEMQPFLFEQVAGPPPQMMRNALYLGTGTPRFFEAAYLAGVAVSDWTWTVKLADLDNDGWEDLFMTNGMTRDFTNSDIPFSASMLEGRTEWDIFEKTPPRREQNLAFRNQKNLQFADVSQEWGLDHLGLSYAAAHADLDRDGDLDLVVVNLDEPVTIYRNESTQGNRVLIQLRGTQGNPYGFGATVHLKTKNGMQMRRLQPVSGFLSSNEPVLHFGLGAAETIDELHIAWPGGRQQTFANLAINRFYTLLEPTHPLPKHKKAASVPTYFKRSEALTGVKHVEREFDDFSQQPLLPNRLSQLGPGVAWGDVDGDGDDDLFVGGAAGQAGQLLFNLGNGRFAPGNNNPFKQHASSEDMGVLFFDIDQDRDLDLYVVSGGVEYAKGSEQYYDRIYLNDGKGNFSNKVRSIFADSSGVISAADFDRDGDLDFFVGARTIPGEYPSTPESRIQRNKTKPGGVPHFADVTKDVAPGLGQSGMVTSAIWSDANGDGWLDLLITHEWGPVRLWLNHQGTFEEATSAAGLADFSGWWNGIAARDFDNDGDMDYVVTNVGLNSKYKASASAPVKLFYGKFGDDLKPRIVEAKYEAGTLLPVRGKSCSSAAIPYLGDKFNTFDKFARASLTDIFSLEQLSNANQLNANTLESGVFLNDGNAHFSFKPLPRLAQISPAFGVVATEVNGDGHADVFLVQNFFGPQAETGRMDGGMGLLLFGNGDGSFEPVWPQRSGLVIPGDATSLTTTDFNGDGRLDFVVGVNDEEVMAFERNALDHDKVFTVRTIGGNGNMTAIGTRITLELLDGSRQTAEIHAGSGYLSQSSATVAFGLGDTGKVQALFVRWPDGVEQTIDKLTNNRHIVINQYGKLSKNGKSAVEKSAFVKILEYFR